MRQSTSSVTTRIARWSAEHPWKATIPWLLFVVVVMVAGIRIGSRQATEAELQTGEAATAATMVNDAALQDPAIENIVITAPDGGQLDPSARTLAGTVRQRFSTVAGVASVSDPVPSSDGKALLVQVQMSGNYDTAPDRVEPLLAATADLQRGHPELRIEETGTASVNREFQDWLGKDIAKATQISVPITLVILVIAFGSLVMAGIPVLLALSAVGAGLGLWELTSHLLPDPGMVPDVIVLIGLAVGVDYSLFYLRRFREERQRGNDGRIAVEVAAATSGHAVIVSGTAVILSMMALYLSNNLVFSGLATGAIIVVAAAMLSSVTVLPALLAKVGPRMANRRFRFLRRRPKAATGESGVWHALLGPALRHPLPSLILAVAALVALAVPALSMSLKSTQLADFPRTLASMRVYDHLLQHFPDTSTANLVIAKVDAGHEAELRAQLGRLAQQAGQDPLFDASLTAAPRYSADGRVGMIELTTVSDFNSPQARQAVAQLRKTLVPETVGTVPGAHYAVGGAVAADEDYTDSLQASLPFVVGAVVILTFLVMLFAFRSPVIALTTVILNLLSCAASFGFLTLVFQHTWADHILSFTSTGHVVSWVPLTLFVVLSGLSLDYHVFVVSRIREAKLSGMTTRNAVASGISRSAGVVTSAAIVMVAVFAVFGTLTFIELKQMGVGLAVAIILDATVIRMVVLPAMMALLGEANWWGGRRRGAMQRLEGALPSMDEEARTTVGRL